MTNKVWTIACSAILGFATTAMAQTAPQSQSNPSSADQKITVTGCLAAGPASPAASTAPGAVGTTGTAGTAGATGTAGTPGATAGANQTFQLTNATVATADNASPPAGATATDPTNAAGQTYRLIANPSALSQHVGKKVALTGTLEGPDPAAAAGPDAKVPALRVESGKIVAESCAQK